MGNESPRFKTAIAGWEGKFGKGPAEKLANYFRNLYFRCDEGRPWELKPSWPTAEFLERQAEKTLADIGLIGRVKVVSVRQTRNTLESFEFALRNLLGVQLCWDNLEHSPLRVGLSDKLGDVLHSNNCQRGLQNKIRNTFRSCIPENMWTRARDAFYCDVPWDFFLKDIAKIMQHSGWSSLAYLAGETMQEIMVTVTALTISGEHEKAEKTVKLLNFFVSGHPFVDELRENYFIMLEE